MLLAAAAPVAIAALAFAPNSAEAGCTNCDPTATHERVGETICLDEATWEAEKHHFREVKGFKRNYWYPMHLACLQGRVGCVKRGRSYKRCKYYSAAVGTVLCHQSPVTGQVTRWTIDGVPGS